MLNQILKGLPRPMLETIRKCEPHNMPEAIKLMAFAYGNLPVSPFGFLPLSAEEFNCLCGEFGRRFTDGAGVITWASVLADAEALKK